MKMYITKTCGSKMVQPFCIVKDGVTLSLGGDDSCGVMNNFSRLEVAFFDENDNLLRDHPLVKKYGSEISDGVIFVMNDAETFSKVVSDFVNGNY